MKNKKICKNCGEEFTPCHKTSEFCSKSCATSWRNKEKLKDGTHNFIGMDHGKSARELSSKGIHPFQKGNMSEDSLKRKAEGIKKARLLESSENRHPWQKPKNFINNEFSRSFSVLKKNSEVSEIHLYIADCVDYSQVFKIGWTRDIKMREKDAREFKLSNLSILKSGSIEFILSLERDLKEKFFDETLYQKYKSTEVFPLELKQEIVDFINSYQ